MPCSPCGSSSGWEPREACPCLAAAGGSSAPNPPSALVSGVGRGLVALAASVEGAGECGAVRVWGACMTVHVCMYACLLAPVGTSLCIGDASPTQWVPAPHDGCQPPMVGAQLYWWSPRPNSKPRGRLSPEEGDSDAWRGSAEH